ncbi:MAG: hypothetical protein KKH98_15780 [Spirochaetes bacterium]|nr:hypothetical protein [Spirochaetota bacterium]
MARIIYGINAEGLGHATRSKPIIEHLMKDHEVMIVTSDKPYMFLKKFFKNIFRTKGFVAIYKKNRINVIKSIFRAFKNTDGKVFLKDLNNLFKSFRPDIVISDLEPFTIRFSIIKRLPLINIDNQCIYIAGKITPSAKDRLDYASTKNLVRTWIPKADYFFICSFFSVKIKKRYRLKRNAKIIKPILRNEVLRLKGSAEKDYILVYQTHDNNYELVDILSQVKQKFYAYKLPENRKIKNIIFRKINATRSLKDLAHCKAVITNGGFSLITEALYLGKPVLSMPILNIYEQKLNGLKVAELGFGEHHKRLTPQIIENFILNIPKYKKRLLNYQGSGNETFFPKLDSTIERLVKKHQARHNKREKFKEKIRKKLKSLITFRQSGISANKRAKIS